VLFIQLKEFVIIRCPKAAMKEISATWTADLALMKEAGIIQSGFMHPLKKRKF
jgi:hypothetical protein